MQSWPCNGSHISLVRNGQLSISYFSVFLTVGQGEAAACKTMVTTHTSPVPQGNIPTQPPFEGCRPSADSANSVPDYVPLPQEVPEDRTPLGPRHTSGTTAHLWDCGGSGTPPWSQQKCGRGKSSLAALALLRHHTASSACQDSLQNSY